MAEIRASPHAIVFFVAMGVAGIGTVLVPHIDLAVHRGDVAVTPVFRAQTDDVIGNRQPYGRIVVIGGKTAVVCPVVADSEVAVSNGIGPNPELRAQVEQPGALHGGRHRGRVCHDGCGRAVRDDEGRSGLHGVGCVWLGMATTRSPAANTVGEVMTNPGGGPAVWEMMISPSTVPLLVPEAISRTSVFAS